MYVQRANVVVIGGGISGLAAAFYLKALRNGVLQDPKLVPRSDHDHVKIIVLEGSQRVGGWINSHLTPEGAVHELGTRSIRPAGVVGKNTLDLVSMLGIEDMIVPVTRSHPASQNRFIYTERGLSRLPSSLGGILRRQDPFSHSLLARLLREPFARKCKADDETIHDFFSRRLGKEVAEYLADPFCRGIFAGDSRQLSVRACFPALFEAERRYGSIIVGSLLHKAEKFLDIGRTPVAQRAKDERWASWTMTGGLQTLSNSLSSWLEEHGVEVHRSTPCRRIEFVPGGDGNPTRKVARIITDEGVLETNHVVCSTSSKVARQLLPAEHSTLSTRLGEIQSSDVAVINLEFLDLRLPVTGFGYLIPSCVQSDILGVVFDSCAFPELDRKVGAATRLTCMMGGAWFNDLFGDPSTVDPDVLLNSALSAIRVQLGINQKPVYTKVNVHHDCIPQYRLGHTALVDDIQSYITKNRLPLTLVGSSYRGVSVNDCIFQARQAARAIEM